MTIEKKLFPHEILIRFASGQEHETAPIGVFQGAHFIEMEILGELTGKGNKAVFTAAAAPKLLPARPLTKKDLKGLIPELVANFEAGLAAERAAHADSKARAEEALNAANAKLAEQQAQIAQLTAERDERAAVAAAHADRLNRIVAEIQK